MASVTPKIRSRKDGAAVPLDATDKRLLNLMQSKFPLEARPYAAVAREAELTEDEVLARIQRLLAYRAGKDKIEGTKDDPEALGKVDAYAVLGFTQAQLQQMDARSELRLRRLALEQITGEPFAGLSRLSDSALVPRTSAVRWIWASMSRSFRLALVAKTTRCEASTTCGCP